MNDTARTRSAWISLDLPPGLVEPVPGGVTDHHITVVYLGDDVDDGRYAEALATAQLVAAQWFDGPLILDIGRIGCFPAPQGGTRIAWYRKVEGHGLLRLHHLLEHLDGSGRTTYTPHMTLCYRDPDESVIFRTKSFQAGFTALSVHRKGSDTVRIPFGRPDGSGDVPGPDPVGRSRDKLLRGMTNDAAEPCAYFGDHAAHVWDDGRMCFGMGD